MKVDISDLEKQLLILESNSHQAEMVKQHIEQQIDSMTPDIKYYDKKLSDLEKRLDAQYDKIGEIEDARKQVSSQIMDIKRGQLESNAIYEGKVGMDECVPVEELVHLCRQKNWRCGMMNILRCLVNIRIHLL